MRSRPNSSRFRDARVRSDRLSVAGNGPVEPSSWDLASRNFVLALAKSYIAAMNASVPDTEVFISAAEADEGFARLLQQVREGVRYVVTSEGRPVARLTPYEAPADSRAAAREVLFEHLRNQKAMNVEITWTRDELHDL